MMSEKPSYEELERRVRELELLKQAQQVAKIGSWDMNVETGEGWWSDELFRLLGYQPGEKAASYSLFREHVHPGDRRRFEKRIMEYTIRVKHVDEIFRFLTTSGDIRFAHSIGEVEFDASGNPLRAYGTFQDITERARAEKALKENEKRLQTLFETISDAVYVHDVNGRIFDFNRVACERLGYDREEILTLQVSDIDVDHPSEAAIRQKIASAITSGPLTIESRHATKDGRVIDVELKINTFSQHDNALFVTVARDTTDRKRTEQALKRSETRYRALFEQAAVGITVASPDGHLLESNETMCAMLGYTPEEMTGLTVSDINWPEDMERQRPLIQEVLDGKRDKFQLEKRYLRKDGQPVWVYHSSNVVRKENGLIEYAIGASTDITELKQAEMALLKKQNMLTHTERMANIGSWEWDVATDTVTWSEQLLHIFGFGPSDNAPSWREQRGLYHAEDFTALEQAVDAAVSEGQPYELDLRIRRNDGTIRICAVHGFPETGPDGRVQRLFGSLQDITDRKKAEKALRETHTFFQQIIDNSQALIIAKNRKGEYILANDISERLLGCQKHEMIGKTDYELFPKETANRLAEDDGRVFETGEPLRIEEKIQIGDRDYTFMTAKFPLFDANGALYAICGMATDITERKRMESELEKSRNLLETTGRMARVGGWELDAATSEVSWTEETCRIHEVPMDQKPSLEQALVFYPPEAREPLTQAIQRALDHGEPYDLEIPFVTAKGKPLWVRTICRPEVIDGKTVKLSGTFQDITERKNAELALKKALDEKVTLLREIHHRVKNNMQAIIGLLRIQARRIKDDQLTAIFNDCQNRIGAMSLIHEALYQSENLAKIDFEAYLKKLCRNLAQAHDAPRRGISLTVSAADVSLNMDQGVAVGMVIAELISNAFKHAFPGDEGGAVSVHLNRPDGETVRLIVSDTGKGLPPDFDLQNPSSLGMRLVSGAVTRELGGSIEATNHGGTRFVIRFKCEEGKQSR